MVSTQQQELFVEKLKRAGKNTAELTVIPGAKHEIFNSPNPVLEGYWGKIFAFLSKYNNRVEIREEETWI